MQSTTHRKEHSKTEFGKKISENELGESEVFYRSNRCVSTNYLCVSISENVDFLEEST